MDAQSKKEFLSGVEVKFDQDDVQDVEEYASTCPWENEKGANKGQPCGRTLYGGEVLCPAHLKVVEMRNAKSSASVVEPIEVVRSKPIPIPVPQELPRSLRPATAVEGHRVPHLALEEEIEQEEDEEKEEKLFRMETIASLASTLAKLTELLMK